MIISKSRAKSTTNQQKKAEKKPPELEEFLDKRDFTGAVTLLEFQQKSGSSKDPKLPEWLAYCHFHNGDHKKALDIYNQLLAGADPDPLYFLYAAACYYYMGLYKDAEELAVKGPKCTLQTRILFHIAHRRQDDTKLMQFHGQLTDAVEDQLSLASVHFLRGHYQEAADIYKRLLLENKDFLALNVYVALCYSKLDYYDVSQEILNSYVQAHPDSALATNFKACNTYRLYQVGKQAEADLKQLNEAAADYGGHPLIKHNVVVFRGGEGALQVLPPLMDLIQEARLNLIIYHLRKGDVGEAYNLIKDLEPVTPSEYTLKAVVLATLGQMSAERRQKAGVSVSNQELLKQAQQYFHLVGSSQTECDTIPGRQCMASCFFLVKQFEDVLIYLTSIKSYLENDDEFHWNFGIAKAASGEYREALESLERVQSDKSRSDFAYLSWLARCYIMTGQPRSAWEMFLRMKTSTESFNLLQLIGNDCYKVGQFYYAAKAFDILERLDANPEYWEGKRGACAGVLQLHLVGKASREQLDDVLNMLHDSAEKQGPQGPQAESMARIITQLLDE